MLKGRDWQGACGPGRLARLSEVCSSLYNSLYGQCVLTAGRLGSSGRRKSSVASSPAPEVTPWRVECPLGCRQNAGRPAPHPLPFSSVTTDGVILTLNVFKCFLYIEFLSTPKNFKHYFYPSLGFLGAIK